MVSTLFGVTTHQLPSVLPFVHLLTTLRRSHLKTQLTSMHSCGASMQLNSCNTRFEIIIWVPPIGPYVYQHAVQHGPGRAELLSDPPCPSQVHTCSAVCAMPAPLSHPQFDKPAINNYNRSKGGGMAGGTASQQHVCRQAHLGGPTIKPIVYNHPWPANVCPRLVHSFDRKTVFDRPDALSRQLINRPTHVWPVRLPPRPTDISSRPRLSARGSTIV